MSHEETLPQAESPPKRRNLADVIPSIATEIAHLDPGSAAALRRGPRRGAGAAAFWKLLAKYNPVGAASKERAWAALIQAIALLTPRGRDPKRRPAHDYSLSMGRVLHEAGISELRLARLLEAAPDLRLDVAVRTCRRLATSESNRFNLVTLGHFLLFGDEETDRRIARDYYRADAAAKRKSEDREISTDA